MRNNRHIIRRQMLEVQLARAEERAGLVEQQVRELYLRHLLPAIERTCDRWSAPRRWRQIDRLEITLEAPALDKVDDHWLQQAKSKLEEALKNMLQEALTPEQTSLPTAEALLDHFLRTGQVPWWADAADSGLIEEVWRELSGTASGSSSDFVKLTPLLRLPAAARRLVQALDDAKLADLTRRLSGTVQSDWLEQLIDILPPLAEKPWIAARRMFWLIIWQRLPVEPLISERLVALFQELNSQGFFKSGISGEDFLQAWDQSTPAPEKAAKKEPEPAPEGKPHKKNEPLTPDKDGQEEPDTVLSAPDRPESESEQELASTTGEAGKIFPDSRFDTTEELYVYNAGLVLTAPFLPALFATLGWIEESRFTGESFRHLAVRLLQYLCDGLAEPPEYQLTLNKVLCGLPPDALYEPDRALLSEEQEAADELLRAILEHAPELGLETIDGLRGSFLLRQGILRASASHWLLHVERETYDIVLDRLPWNVQVVRLPWMEAPVLVDWR